MYAVFWWGNVRERDHWGDTGVDGRIILNVSLRSGMRGVDLINLAQERDRWWALVNAILNLGGSIKCGEFLDYLKTGYLLKKDSAPWSK